MIHKYIIDIIYFFEMVNFYGVYMMFNFYFVYFVGLRWSIRWA